MSEVLTVAVVQAAPAFNDLDASLSRAVGHIEDAAAKGARLVVFGESWLSGYPAWLDHGANVARWGHAPTKRVYAATRASSVRLGGPTIARLAELSGDLGVTVVIGANERVETGPGNGTLYNALLTFSGGSLANHHRKLVPTYTERLVWGPGDPRGLQAVDIGSGVRVGGLVCWEHWMPLARQALHDSGEHVHVAVWPAVNSPHLLASRHYAFEGRCFVIAAGSLLSAGDVPADLDLPDASPQTLLLDGGSTVIGPDGAILVEPIRGEQALVICELDLARIAEEQMTLDVTGHYARPDVFDFTVKR